MKQRKKNLNSVKSSLKDSITSSDTKSTVSFLNTLTNLSLYPDTSEYLWRSFDCTQEFLNSYIELPPNTQKEVYSTITTILNGDFTNIEEQVCYEDNFLYGTYFYTFPSNLKMLFAIYFIKGESSWYDNEETMDERLSFLNISYSVVVLKESINDFLVKYSVEENKGIEFDKTGLLENSDIFFSETKENNNHHIIKSPIGSISKKFKRTYQIKVANNVVEMGGDYSKYELQKIYKDVFYIIENKKTLNYKSLLEGKDLLILPSKKEIILVNTNKNVIISGRPGTGKTYIILLKTLLMYMNCINEESKLTNNITNDEIRSEIMLKQSQSQTPGERYKIVFTSLSQTLCMKVEGMYCDIISKMNLKYKYVKHKLEDILNLSSFDEISQYPLFINFRKIIFLIDGTVNFQFFDREVNNKLSKSFNDCDIRYIPNCQYKVCYSSCGSSSGQYSKTHFIRAYQSWGHSLKEECNAYHFINFYEQFCTKKKIKEYIDPIEVYSQIISVIKGSLFSYQNGNNGITRYQYLKSGAKLSMFNEEQKNFIYDTFIEYEIWKNANGYFDFQDVVNHLIRVVINELIPNNTKVIDYLFIDEVQDFSINQLYLMTLISRNIKVLAGDTCQTISKSNRFRFCDVNGISYVLNYINPNFTEPTQVQIKINFRCTSAILHLAHFVFNFIFKFFSETLDKIKLDFSTVLSENKPYEIVNLKSFLNEINTNDEEKVEKKEYKGLRQKLLFGFKHCFLCKNDESAALLRNMFKDTDTPILSSSIAESKGLEYDIVILYNFFKDIKDEEVRNSVKKIWMKLLNGVTIVKKENPNLVDYQHELELEELSAEEINKILNEYKYGFYPELTHRFIGEYDPHKYFSLCSELKELYVAITRAKVFLFIYDEDQQVYPIFRKMFKEASLLSTEHNIIDKAKKYIAQGIEYSKEMLDNLYQIALSEFNSRFFLQAEFHFRLLHEETMKKKCIIYRKYQEIEDMKTKNETKTETFLQINQELLKYCEDNNFDENDIRGELMLNLELYDNAINYFKVKKNDKKCGMIALMQKDYETANNYFKLAKEYSFAIETFDLMNNHKELFTYIYSIRDMLDLKHYVYFYQEYSNKYLMNFNIKLMTIGSLKENYQKCLHKEDNSISINSKISILYNEYNNNSKEDSMILRYINSKDVINGVNVFPYLNDTKDKAHCYIRTFNIDENVFSNVSMDYSITKTAKENENNREVEILLNDFVMKYTEGLQSKTDASNRIRNDYIQTNRNTLNDIKANDVVRTLFDLKIFKTDFAKIILNKIQMLLMPKVLGCTVKEDYNKVILMLVRLTKAINIDENEIKYLLQKIAIITGYIESILPLLSSNTKLLMFSAVLKKRKLLLYSLNQIKMTFIVKHPLINVEEQLYLFNAFLSVNIVSLLRAFNKINDNNTETILNKVISIANVLKPYNKIYSIINLIIEYNFNEEYKVEKVTNNTNLNTYIYIFLNFLSSEDNSFETLMKIIEIGNTISFIIISYTLFQIKVSNQSEAEKKNHQIIKTLSLLSNLLYSLSTTSFSILKAKLAFFAIMAPFGISYIPKSISELKMYSIFENCLLSTKSLNLFNLKKAKQGITCSFKDTNSNLHPIYFDAQNKFIIISRFQSFQYFYQIVKRFIMTILKRVYNPLKYTSLIKPFLVKLIPLQYSMNYYLLNFERKYLNVVYDKISTKEDFLFYFMKSIKYNKKPSKSKSSISTEENDHTITIKDEYALNYAYPYRETEIINFAPLTILLGSFNYEYEYTYLDKYSSFEQTLSTLSFFYQQLYIDLYKLSISKFPHLDVQSSIVNYSLFVNLMKNYLKIEIPIDLLVELNHSILSNAHEQYEAMLLKELSYLDVLDILSNETYTISPILKVLWIKKIYSMIYSIIKTEYHLHSYTFYSYNQTVLDYQKTYSLYHNSHPNNNELYTFFSVVIQFIQDYLPTNKYETHNKENYKYSTWIRNYYELEIYLIAKSLLTIDETNLHSPELKNIINTVNEEFKKHSFYDYNLSEYNKTNPQDNSIDYWFYVVNVMSDEEKKNPFNNTKKNEFSTKKIKIFPVKLQEVEKQNTKKEQKINKELVFHKNYLYQSNQQIDYNDCFSNEIVSSIKTIIFEPILKLEEASSVINHMKKVYDKIQFDLFK